MKKPKQKPTTGDEDFELSDRILDLIENSMFHAAERAQLADFVKRGLMALAVMRELGSSHVIDEMTGVLRKG